MLRKFLYFNQSRSDFNEFSIDNYFNANVANLYVQSENSIIVILRDPEYLFLAVFNFSE